MRPVGARKDCTLPILGHTKGIAGESRKKKNAFRGVKGIVLGPKEVSSGPCVGEKIRTTKKTVQQTKRKETHVLGTKKKSLDRQQGDQNQRGRASQPCVHHRKTIKVGKN